MGECSVGSGEGRLHIQVKKHGVALRCLEDENRSSD